MPTTSEEHKYTKFVHSNGIAYAYLEVPIEFLSEELPTDATWSTKEDETQKTIEEYVIWLQKSNDETKAIICLMATENTRYRVPIFTYNDLQDWETWLNTKSFTIDDFLTIEERNTLMESEVYSVEE
jgi:alpha-amylase/alpha-mannosidase (GH57 family)